MKSGTYGLLVLVLSLTAVMNGRAGEQQPSHPSATAPAQAAPEFVPPHLVAAWPIEYPIRSVAAGVVVLEVSVDDNGKVADVIPRRDIPSLTAAAVFSVKKWEYKAAMREGVPIWSRATVAVIFGPSVTPGPIELPALVSDFQAQRHRYPPEPPEILSVSPGVFPVGYVGLEMSTIFDVKVNVDGSIEGIEPIHDVRGLTETSLAAAKQWKFQPARYEGKPIGSSVAVAFVYRPPAIDNP
ncbi:MAG TPA: energy transducer TonB [Candidatus Acidoferrales bacterium]|nr:energy transducer TonB [Candidatus Acidoferrales bacterium]